MKKRLFALLIGINNYASKDHFGLLYGAEADAQGLMDYLQDFKQEFDLQMVTLLGVQANRKNVIAGIQQHLSQAGPEDVALFYFSGHGLREESPLVFQQTEGTKAIEALACYDSFSATNIPGLANKELRYLLQQASSNKPHLAVITDCCHSAKTTRGGIQPIRRTALYPMLPARNWDQFVFAQHLSETSIRQARALEEVLPEAKHVHLAACQAEESAFELGNSGMFTGHVLEVLRQSSGSISYYQLCERVKSLIRARSLNVAQTPNVYQSPHSLLLDETFLGLTQRKSKIFATVSVGKKAILINRGSIHGIPSEEELKGVELSIFEQNDPKRAEVASATIVATGMSTAEILLFPPDFEIQKDRLYLARIDGLYQRDFNTALYGEDSSETGKKLLREVYRQAFNREIQEVPQATTDCVVLLHDQQMALVHPDDEYSTYDWAKFVPLAQQQYSLNPGAAEQVVQQLLSIAQWNFVKNIQNHAALIGPELLGFSIDVAPGDEAIRAANRHAEGYFDIEMARAWDSESKAWIDTATLYFQLSNQSSVLLHVSLVDLSQLFGIHPNILDDNAMSVGIDPGMSKTFAYGFQLEPFIKAYNLRAENGLFRLFVANQPFNLYELTQDPLSPPERSKMRTAKDLVLKKQAQLGKGKPAWAVFDYPIQLLNPEFQRQL